MRNSIRWTKLENWRVFEILERDIYGKPKRIILKNVEQVFEKKYNEEDGITYFFNRFKIGETVWDSKFNADTKELTPDLKEAVETIRKSM